MNDPAANTLKNAADPMDISQAAIDLARSRDAGDIGALAAFLNAPGSYLRLDAAEDYNGTIAGLRLSRVMQTLSENRAPAAEQTLLQLTHSGPFNGDVLRKQLLAAALAQVRPSPPPAITYWDKLSPPGGV